MPLTDLLGGVDRGLLDAATAMRTEALTALMTVLSAWWVKSLAIPALGVVADLRRAPRRLPATLVPVAIALLAASLASRGVKALADRARPPLDGAAAALVDLPADASLPSGHATTAFAAAGVVALMHPRLRAPALCLAALVALSRVYLGVHYPSDIAAGALLGLALAVAVVAAARRLGGRRISSPPPPPAPPRAHPDRCADPPVRARPG